MTRDVRYQAFDDLPGAVVYIPYRQRHHETMNWQPTHLIVETESDPLAILPPVRAAVRELDPHQPLGQATTLDDLVGEAFRGTRFAAQMLSFFAIAALTLATIGVYGVIVFSVSQRRREIGVRMALGAARRDVIRLVGRQVLTSAAIGLAVGISGALVLSRFIEGLLRGVSRGDPMTLAGVVVILVTVSALAAYLPARRAAAIPPTDALRAD